MAARRTSRRQHSTIGTEGHPVRSPDYRKAYATPPTVPHYRIKSALVDEEIGRAAHRLHEGGTEAEPVGASLEDAGRLRSILIVNATSRTAKSTTPTSVHRTGSPFRFCADDCRTSGASTTGATAPELAVDEDASISPGGRSCLTVEPFVFRTPCEGGIVGIGHAAIITEQQLHLSFGERNLLVRGHHA